MVRPIVILAASLGVACATSAYAQQSTRIEPAQQKYKCTSKDAVGGWSLIFFSDDAMQCSFTVDKNRQITESACIEEKTNNPVATLKGKLVVDKKCAVTASLKVSSGGVTTNNELTAYMSFDQTAFTGVLSEAKSGRFIGVSAVRAK